MKRLHGYIAICDSLGLAAAMTAPASAITIRGIDFPMGEASFADEVIDFNKVYADGLSQEEVYARNWNASTQAFDDPTAVLGAPNSSWNRCIWLHVC